MNCDIVLKINGEEVKRWASSPEIRSISDLRNFLASKNKNEIKEIADKLRDIQDVEYLDISDISENSIGVITPAELRKDFTGSEYALLGALNIPLSVLNSNIVVAGMSDYSIPTQFYKDHIYLNTNYLQDKYNNALALFELALYTADPDNYEMNSKILRNINQNNKDSVEINGIIAEMIKPDYDKSEQLVNFIKRVYNEATLKKQNDLSGELTGSVDLLNNTKTVDKIGEEYGNKSISAEKGGDREINYLPSERLRITDLKQGDLVLLTNKSGKQYFEIFQGYRINADGKYVLISTHLDNRPNSTTRGTYVSTYTEVSGFTTMKARRHDDSNYEIKPISDKMNDYSKITVSSKFRYWNFESLMQLFKEGKAVIIEGKNKNFVTNVQGSTLTLDNGTTLSIDEIFNKKSENKTEKEKEFSIAVYNQKLVLEEYTKSEVENNDA